jgi:hypothetical protein
MTGVACGIIDQIEPDRGERGGQAVADELGNAHGSDSLATEDGR